MADASIGSARAAYGLYDGVGPPFAMMTFYFRQDHGGAYSGLLSRNPGLPLALLAESPTFTVLSSIATIVLRRTRGAP